MGKAHRLVFGELTGCNFLLLGADARCSRRSCCRVLSQVLRTSHVLRTSVVCGCKLVGFEYVLIQDLHAAGHVGTSSD